MKAVFAPYDEVTKGMVTAIEQNKLGTKVAAYGIDISNADIELMTKKDSPWKATATTDPSAVGAEYLSGLDAGAKRAREHPAAANLTAET